MRHLLSHRSYAKSIPVWSGFFRGCTALSKTPPVSELLLTIRFEHSSADPIRRRRKDMGFTEFFS
jgi:hypothetical protein